MVECNWCGLWVETSDAQKVEVAESCWPYVCPLCLAAIDHTREVIQEARNATQQGYSEHYV
jgi:hypothetical protein